MAATATTERVDVYDDKHSDISEFHFPVIFAPTVAYLRLHTELKMNEVFEAIENIDLQTRLYSGLHYNFYLLLCGLLVKFSKADDAYYIPIPLLPGDKSMRVYWNTKVINKESFRAKLQVGKVPRLLLYRDRVAAGGATPATITFPELHHWELPGAGFGSQSLRIKDSGNSFELNFLPLNRPIAQIVFYGPVHTQSWLKKGRLWSQPDGEGTNPTGNATPQLLGEFQEPFEATVFDKERFGLPLTQNAAVYTFTFVNYLKHDSSSEVSQKSALILRKAPKLEFDVEAQFLTSEPVIEIWGIVGSGVTLTK